MKLVIARSCEVAVAVGGGVAVADAVVVAVSVAVLSGSRIQTVAVAVAVGITAATEGAILTGPRRGAVAVLTNHTNTLRDLLRESLFGESREYREVFHVEQLGKRFLVPGIRRLQCIFTQFCQVPHENVVAFVRSKIEQLGHEQSSPHIRGHLVVP